MSPSLRNLTAEYVKTRLQSVKLPLSASGRFNVAAVKARIPARLRKAKPAGVLEDEETSPADDPEYCVVETNGGAQERVRAAAFALGVAPELTRGRCRRTRPTLCSATKIASRR